MNAVMRIKQALTEVEDFKVLDNEGEELMQKILSMWVWLDRFLNYY